MITEERYQEVIKPLIDIATSKQSIYGSALDEMGDVGLLELAMMKLSRAKNIRQGDVVDITKSNQEIGDAVTHLVCLLMRSEINESPITDESNKQLILG